MTHEQLKSKKVQNPINYEPKIFQNDPGKDQTQPDQSMSLREMLTRYSRGLPLEDNGRPTFFDEEEEENSSQMGINPKTLDLVDIENMKLENKQRVLDLDKEIKEQISTGKKQKAEKDAQKAEKEAKINKLINEPKQTKSNDKEDEN